MQQPLPYITHMLIIPAIDLKDGKCVRLKQGAMNDATIFSEDPAATAEHWLKQGAKPSDSVRTLLGKHLTRDLSAPAAEAPAAQ